MTHNVGTFFLVSCLFVRLLPTEHNRREAVKGKHGFHTIVDQDLDNIGNIFTTFVIALYIRAWILNKAI